MFAVVDGLLVDFLDTTLNLNFSEYKPFRKPNDSPSYNYSQNIIKQLPKMVNSRINSISSNEHVFREATPMYQAALDHNHKLRFERP